MTCPHGKYEQGKCVFSSDCDYVCPHEMFWGGMCAICGIHEDQGKSGSSSSEHINISHRDTGIAVSVNEAKRIAKEDEQRLLKEKKLSLIVDLDQTILHATWEPYIANWVKERKADNSTLVKDISQFTLDGSPLIYSIKLRPGLREFLQEISRKYEMHIYTMGTRSYADAVVRVIDPDGRLFQDRILSRDENGSMTRKRLERLFPFDQSRVVVLDDRADVWDYSANLIQIKPYEYFIGIGDINSPFAQPKTDIIPSTDELIQTSAEKSSSSSISSNVNNVKNDYETANNTTITPPITNGTITNIKADASINATEKKEDVEKITVPDIEAQQKANNQEAPTTASEEEKADATEEKEEEEEEEEDLYSDTEDDDNNSVAPSVSSIESNPPKKKEKGKERVHDDVPSTANDSKEHLPNTHDTDDILRVMRRALLDVHNVYFRDLEKGKSPHVAPILNSLKSRVMGGVNVVFSGVIPINNPGPNTQSYPQNHWIWRMATSFGASCLHELTGKVTHLVAVNPGTTKVHTARRHENIKIVLPAWITDSVWNWKRQNETQYLLPLAELSPAESEVENPESTSLEIDFGWDDAEVDAALGDSDDDDDSDIDDENFDESDIGSNPQSKLESSNQVNSEAATSSTTNKPSSNNNEDKEELDYDFLDEEMDAMFDYDGEDGDDREYGESDDYEDDDDHDSMSLAKRGREDDDDDDSDEDHPTKKHLL